MRRMKPFLSSLCALLVLCAAPAWADLSRDEMARTVIGSPEITRFGG